MLAAGDHDGGIGRFAHCVVFGRDIAAHALAVCLARLFRCESAQRSRPPVSQLAPPRTFLWGPASLEEGPRAVLVVPRASEPLSEVIGRIHDARARFVKDGVVVVVCASPALENELRRTDVALRGRLARGAEPLVEVADLSLRRIVRTLAEARIVERWEWEERVEAATLIRIRELLSETAPVPERLLELWDEVAWVPCYSHSIGHAAKEVRRLLTGPTPSEGVAAARELLAKYSGVL